MAPSTIPTPAEFTARIVVAHQVYSGLRALYSEVRLHRPLQPEELNDDLLADLVLLGERAKNEYDEALMDWQLANAFRNG